MLNPSIERTKAYNEAIYVELKNRGLPAEQALKTFHKYYRPMVRTWGLQLNPEAFVEEMLSLKEITTNPQGKMVPIRQHSRNPRHPRKNELSVHAKTHTSTLPDGTKVVVVAQKRFGNQSVRFKKLLTDAKGKIVVDVRTGKPIFDRSQSN